VELLQYIRLAGEINRGVAAMDPGELPAPGEGRGKNHYIEETRFCIKKYKKVLTDSNRRNIMRSQQRNSNPSKGRKEVQYETRN